MARIKVPKYARLSFEERKANNAGIVRKKNSALYAGEPMYYYCLGCGAEMVEPETHPYPAPRWCSDCVAEGRGEN